MSMPPKSKKSAKRRAALGRPVKPIAPLPSPPAAPLRPKMTRGTRVTSFPTPEELANDPIPPIVIPRATEPVAPEPFPVQAVSTPDPSPVPPVEPMATSEQPQEEPIPMAVLAPEPSPAPPSPSPVLGPSPTPTPAPTPIPAPQAAPFVWDEFEGKALIASRSPWGTIAGGLVAWAVSRYGLNLDQTTCNLIAGVAVIVASYAMRWLTTEPVTGVLKAKPGVAVVRLRRDRPPQHI